MTPSTRSPWNMETLSLAPRAEEDPDRSVQGVNAIFYQGLPWKGRSPLIFAYYVLPSVQPSEKVPAMVLMHGGGVDAFIPGVQLWLGHGYAVIAMGSCGCISSGGQGNHSPHLDGGPAGWDEFDPIDEPMEDP